MFGEMVGVEPELLVELYEAQALLILRGNRASAEVDVIENPEPHASPSQCLANYKTRIMCLHIYRGYAVCRTTPQAGSEIICIRIIDEEGGG